MSFLSSDLVAECDIQANITKVVNTISSAKIWSKKIPLQIATRGVRLPFYIKI